VVLIGGPCVIESQRSCLSIAGRLKEITSQLKVPFVFKASFDKANRLSHQSFRGPGLTKGLKILSKVKEKYSLPILSDIHCKEQIKEVIGVLDVIQIPAFLCRQTNLVIAAAKTGKVINIKKGQFLAPWDMLPIVKKIESVQCRKILLTERGSSFGYNNLVSDFRSLAIMGNFGYPVIYDATHSVQLPGATGSCSGGQRQFVAGLCRAAVAFGCDGLFLEVHFNPDKALCDGANSINLRQLQQLLIQIKNIERILKISNLQTLNSKRNLKNVRIRHE
jgi:2-dehydro-3-deoxyphosphooctonate aldolase (KDO 8-P synthase)